MQFVDEVIKTDPSDHKVNERFINTKHGTQIKLERRDPYGFVHVVWMSGPTPQELSGVYSDWDQARRAVEIYIHSKTFNKVVDELPLFEKAVYKKVRKNAKETGRLGEEATVEWNA